VAVKNYGTIEYVTVSGSLTSGTTTSYAAGIASCNGYKTVEGAVVFGKILHCVNKADITTTATILNYGGATVLNGVAQSGGICAAFLGEMRYCVNLGAIRTAGNSGTLFIPPTGLQATSEGLINVSDCYNAGETKLTNTSSLANVYAGGLFGSGLSNVSSWTNQEGRLAIDNVFNFGDVTRGFELTDPPPALSLPSYAAYIGLINGSTFIDLHVADIFSNVYYRDGITTRLFFVSNSATTINGEDGRGTFRVQKVIQPRTEAEFAAQALADALNAGRTGADAPWEYVDGSAYPTLKFQREGYDPAADNVNVVDEEIAKEIAEIVENTEFTTNIEYCTTPKMIVATDESDLPAVLTAGDREVSASDFETDEVSGRVYVSTDKIKALIARDANLSERVPPDAGILSLPVTELTVANGVTALFSYSMDLSQFAGVRVGDLTVMKLTPYKLRSPLKVSGFADLADERYIVTDETGEVIPDDEVITDSTKNYILTVAVKDNGRYDWDATTTNGHIVDPFAVGAPAGAAANPNSNPVSGSGGGGCDAGAGGMAFLAAALVLAIKRRRG
jgi:hypothetical protein